MIIKVKGIYERECSICKKNKQIAIAEFKFHYDSNDERKTTMFNYCVRCCKKMVQPCKELGKNLREIKVKLRQHLTEIKLLLREGGDR